jgi:hypothetical protein
MYIDCDDGGVLQFVLFTIYAQLAAKQMKESDLD